MEFKKLILILVALVAVAVGGYITYLEYFLDAGGSKPLPKPEFEVTIYEWNVDTSLIGGNARYTGKGTIANIGKADATSVYVKVRLTDDPGTEYANYGDISEEKIHFSRVMPGKSAGFEFYIEGPKESKDRFYPYAEICGYESEYRSSPCI